MERGSGILLHITSLPSPHGIGTFGKEAYEFIDYLKKAGQKYWQVLPLNPTSYGDSPYQSFSAFALNPYFIDLDFLVKEGLLTEDDVKDINGGTNPHYVDYGVIYNERFNVLRKAYKNGYKNLEEKILRFVNKHKVWIKDYAAFMVIKGLHDGKSYQEWEDDLRLYKEEAIEKVINENIDEYNFWIFLQYKAYQQYLKLRRYAKRKGIKLIGDLPIYVSIDSSDVWANPSLFQLDDDYRPTAVAGCPPDFFSATGQLWGNPLYDWNEHKRTKFRWWKKRIGAMAKLFDAVRIDHFRGFESYWSIPFGEKTAVNGKWVVGPGIDLFNELKKVTKDCQIIAEDLGLITKKVVALKRKCKLPGMKVFQFGFEDYDKCLTSKGEVAPNYYLDKETKEKLLINPFLPHHYEKNSIGYIGTHDNDTELGFIKTHQKEVPAMKDYLHIDNDDYILDTMIGSLMRSNCDVAIFTLQDLLHLDSFARMNTPSTAIGNWQYRFIKEDFDLELANSLNIMVKEANR